MRKAIPVLILALCALPAAGGGKFHLGSPAFSDRGELPRRHTCDGEDLSPLLTWAGTPAGTAELVLSCTDPDAPGGEFVHWLVAGIPPGESRLPEGAGSLRRYVQGRNDFGTRGYRGPCPPPGRPHRYVFELIALKEKTALKPGFTIRQLRKALEGRVLGRARRVGWYGR